MNQLWLCLSFAVASGAFFAGRIPLFYGVAFCALIFVVVLWEILFTERKIMAENFNP